MSAEQTRKPFTTGWVGPLIAGVSTLILSHHINSDVWAIVGGVSIGLVYGVVRLRIEKSRSNAGRLNSN
jgi:hypothetical protein